MNIQTPQELSIHKLTEAQFEGLFTQTTELDENAIFLVQEEALYTADWNQNNEKKSDYVANRPCYSIITDTEINSDAHPFLQTEETELGYAYNSFQYATSTKLIEGELYAVTFSHYAETEGYEDRVSTTYECIAKHDITQNTLMLGNSKWYGGDEVLVNDLPFGVIVVGESFGGHNTELYSEIPGEWTSVDFYHRVETIYKLDSKYLPEEYATKEELNNALKNYITDIDTLLGGDS